MQEDWFEQASCEQVLITIFHELRHFYQHKQIYKCDGKKKSTILFTINKWKHNFENNIIPNGKNDYEYLRQDIEKDAIKYSQKMFTKFLDFINY